MGLKILVLTLCITFAFSAYVQSVAKELTIYGAIAYEDTTEIQQWTCQPCTQYKLTDINLFSYEPKSLFGYVGYSQSLQAIVITFRGTVVTQLANVVTDITLFQSDYPRCANCKVHTGFYEGISLLSSFFISALKKVANAHPGAPIYVAGHSLGGALASLAAPIIKENFPNNKLLQVITGGKPRVGNKQFADWYNSNIQAYRVVYKNDIVPHIPSSGPLSGLFSHQAATHQMSLRHHLNTQEQHEQLLTANYFHEGKEAWYKSGWSEFYICSNEDSTCSNSIWAIFYSIPDHMPYIYLKITSTATEL